MQASHQEFQLQILETLQHNTFSKNFPIPFSRSCRHVYLIFLDKMNLSVYNSSQ